MSIPARPAPRPSDFNFVKQIGEGSFSTVYLVREIATNTEFAMKVVDKRRVHQTRAVESVFMEKEVLARTNHVFIVRLHYTFQDDTRLFYVLDYACNGELLSYLNRLTSFDVPCARFYSAEILSALNYLHDRFIVHRDVKPENVLLTESMHIKLADFGSAVILNDSKVKAPTFTGTAEYVSPEMLSPISRLSEVPSSEKSTPTYGPKELTYLMDYWALGCVVYQFISGRSPFRPERNKHIYEAFSRISNLSYNFMDGFDAIAEDLVKNLLVIDPAGRLGSPARGGPSAVREHDFFIGIDWETLPHQYPPTLSPNLEPVASLYWEEVPANVDGNQKSYIYNEVTQAIGQLTDEDRAQLFILQEKQNPYNRFARNRLILKQGILYKRRGLSVRKRMFLLTEGPHLFYVDIDSMTFKGEVPFSSFIRCELKSSKLFFIHVPKRTFYLEDPSGRASAWVDRIHAVKQLYYSDPCLKTDFSSSVDLVDPFDV